MCKKAITYILTVIIATGCFFTAVSAKPVKKEYGVSAKAYVLMSEKTGEVIDSRNMDLVLPMASTTKIMSAVIALERLDLDTAMKIRYEDINVEGSNLYIKTEDKLTLEDVLYGLMLCSGNDCAGVIAYNIAGSKENFVKLMNEKAKELGLSRTSFETPSGLDGKNHHTTAYELAKIMQYAMGNEMFMKITSSKSHKISDGKVVTNHNRLLKIYEYCTGGKTGFTKKAGRCLVSSAQKDGDSLICVTLNAPNDWNDHTYLYDSAFGRMREYTIADTNTDRFKIPVVGGEKNEAQVMCEKNLVISGVNVPDGKKTVFLPKFIYAPAQKNDIVGKIIYYNKNNEPCDEINLILCEKIDIIKAKDGLWTRILKFLNII